MTPRVPRPSRKRSRTASERSLARFARAARVLPPVTLDAGQAVALDRILTRTRESYAAWVRRHIEKGA